MLRIMTSNVWGDYFGNPVDARQADLLQIYRTYAPDVIGFQEVTARWYASEAFRRLTEDYVIVGPELWEGNNYVPMAVKKDLRILQTGYSAFEDTPDKTKGLTWVVAQTEEGKTFGACNVHFWWKYGPAEFDEIRKKNARQLCAKMKDIRAQYNCPVFGFGDMNCVLQYPVFELVYRENGILPLIEMTQQKDLSCTIREFPKADSAGCYHGVKSEEDYQKSIDHIVGMGTGYAVEQYRVVEDQFALDVTDHCPVFADVEL